MSNRSKPPTRFLGNTRLGAKIMQKVVAIYPDVVKRYVRERVIEYQKLFEICFPRLKLSTPLLILRILCISGILYSGQFFRLGIENHVAPALAMQLTGTQLPTDTSTPTVTSFSPTPTFMPTVTLTNTPLPPTNTPTPTGLNVITIRGATDEEFGFIVPNNTLFDATNWVSNAIGPIPDGTTTRAVEVFVSNDSTDGLANITWQGGVIAGSIPQSWDWYTTHEFGGGGFFIHNTRQIEWQSVRIHNVEDGIKLREEPEYSNNGSWLIRDCYFTAIRDDAIDNDRFEPGTVQDCLFDGVFVFLSEQDENVGRNPPIGSNEDDTIYARRVYVRLYGTNDAEGPGKWFKWQGNVPHHKLVISDSIFAIGAEPRLGWASETIPPEVIWEGNQNFILWLGAPGEYGGPIPEGVTFLEGEAARDKWISVRNNWLTDHNLPAQDFPADYNPHNAPVMQIPIGFSVLPTATNTPTPIP